MSDNRPELRGDMPIDGGDASTVQPSVDPVEQLMRETNAAATRFPEFGPALRALSETALIFAQAERAAGDPRIPEAVAEVLMAGTGIVSRPGLVRGSEGRAEEQAAPSAAAAQVESAEPVEAPVAPAEEPVESAEQTPPTAEVPEVDLGAYVAELRADNNEIGQGELVVRILMKAGRPMWPAEIAELVFGSAGRDEIKKVMVIASKIASKYNVGPVRLLENEGYQFTYVNGVNPTTGRNASAYQIVPKN